VEAACFDSAVYTGIEEHLIGEVVIQLRFSGPQGVRGVLRGEIGRSLPERAGQKRSLIDAEVAVSGKYTDARVEGFLFLDGAQAENAGELAGEVVFHLAKEAVRIGYQLGHRTDIYGTDERPDDAVGGSLQPVIRMVVDVEEEETRDPAQ